MSKMIDLYKEQKKLDNEKILCFKTGSFYVFFNEDAKLVSEILKLKITPFSSDGDKCGFPINSKEDKFKILDENNIKYEIIEPEVTTISKKTKTKVNIKDEIINEIINIDLMNLTEKESFIKICMWQSKLK